MYLQLLQVACSDFGTDVHVGKTILEKQVENVRKLRNTCRFMLGVLHDYTAQVHQHQQQQQVLKPIDRYMLHLIRDHFLPEAMHHYEQVQLYKVHQLLVSFVYEASAFYLDLIKDRMYSDAATSPHRQCAQYIVNACLQAVLQVMAPIACHLSQEIYQHYPLRTHDSVFLHKFDGIVAPRAATSMMNDWKQILQLRHEIYQEMDKLRASKQIGSSLECHVQIAINSQVVLTNDTTTTTWAALLARVFETTSVSQMEHDLEEVFIVSKVTLAANGAAAAVQVRPIQQDEDEAYHKCARCWKFTRVLVHDLCPRCTSVVLVTTSTSKTDTK